MPKIEVKKSDLSKLLLQDMDTEKLETLLESAKAELDDISAESYKIELNDTNRPDLWSCAGIARHLNQYTEQKSYDYGFFAKSSEYQIIVDTNLKNIRPYIAGFSVRNINVDEALLLELIQNQEKLTQNFGKKREDIAIGIYKLANIQFPVHYRAVDPERMAFVPLGETRELNLREILEIHPKGIEFGNIVKDYEKYPIILDDKDDVLSFPPIINSRYIGEVEIGDTELFVELTGFNLNNMLLVANIFACDLADRGAEIIPVEVKYPYKNEYDETVVVPYNFNIKMGGNKKEFEKMVGFVPGDDEISVSLKKMGYKNISIDGDKVEVIIPPFRNDIMHIVDIIEDYIIGKGYNNFEVKMPFEFTKGQLSDIELFSDKLRNIAFGMGFQEVISNILTSEDNIYHKMNSEERNAVEILNPKTESYNILQNSIIPSLLEIEAFSAKADYPHRIFEVGEVVIKDKNENHGSKTLLNIGLLNAHPKSNVSEMRSDVDNIF